MYLLEVNSVSLFDKIVRWFVLQDQWLFVHINTIWSNGFFDAVFPIWREQITWMPVYLFLFVFAVFNFGWKSLPWILFFVVTVSLCDQISSAVLKDMIGRTRPCRDPFFYQFVRLLLNRCPVSGSFTSSHATNHFGMAVFLAITFKKYLHNWVYLFYFWAATIAYGQVYVGVHYPLDVIGGAVVGSIIGYLAATFFNKKIGLPPLNVLPIDPELEAKPKRI